MTTDREVILQSLQHAAETGVDLTDAVFAEFFSLCVEAEALMAHTDVYMRGRMLEQVFELVISDDLGGDGSFLAWELDNHTQAYGVAIAMYAPLFEALHSVVRNVVGAVWRPEFEEAWTTRAAAILAAIENHEG